MTLNNESDIESPLSATESEPPSMGADGAGEPRESVPGPESEAKPFASADAPWVGAEKKWLAGEESPPSQPKAVGDLVTQPLALVTPDEDDEDDLLISPVLPAGHSLAPLPHKSSGAGPKIAIAALLSIAIIAAAVIYLLNTRLSAREEEMLALRESAEKVESLERQITELLAQGGAENEQRASELREELEAAKSGAGEATEGSQGVATNRPAWKRRDRVDRGATAPASAAGATGRQESTGGQEARGEGDSDQGEGDISKSAASVAAVPGSTEDDLLDNAVSPREKNAEPATKLSSSASSAPSGAPAALASPSRDQVKASMGSVEPEVKKCGPGKGRVVLSVAVSGATGRVVSSEPTGEFAGTAVGLCAARAVKLAKFPTFQQERLVIKYPFDL